MAELNLLGDRYSSRYFCHTDNQLVHGADKYHTVQCGKSDRMSDRKEASCHRILDSEELDPRRRFLECNQGRQLVWFSRMGIE